MSFSLPLRSLLTLLLALSSLSPAQATPPPKKPSAITAPPAHGGSPGAYANRQDVMAWAEEQTRPGAPLAAWTQQELLEQLGQAQYQARAAQLMMPAPSGQAKDWAAYRDRFVEPRRLQAGLRFWEQHAQAFERAERQYGVPAEVIAGIIGVETYYGQIMGNYRVLDALATLAFDFPGGRSDRTSYFREQLAEFLLWARAEGRPASEFKGSFAGAMGFGQFMPSNVRRLAVDFDADGRIDLIENPVDAIGSIARFLVEHGWQSGLATQVPLTLPEGLDPAQLAKLLAPDIEPTWSAEQLKTAGLDLPLPHPGPWALVRLENGATAPPTHVLGSRNFYVVTRYNRSSYYALAVLTLGERLAVLRRAGQVTE
ncbi:membrane-bound lytic murein transglycosylase B [Inhella inkyongensis]|uniref:Membrane-bound lytic murein transglycosylase B n=1 Tax=Inhella inkyongensis TaxID=392593 RepID=A0A840S6R5_9BURK|nr:lytic murein transglycosylase B [Inhella inkyongensis]MBB5206135.1 membrane-bound lytic murein transglycosylase B [Inhella inkyongensis]